MLADRVASLVPLLVAVACATPPPPVPAVELEKVVDGLTRPVGLVAARDGSGRLFVVGQRGVVRILAGGVLAPEPFLDISDRVSCCGERGLLGLAFHPRYRDNGGVLRQLHGP